MAHTTAVGTGSDVICTYNFATVNLSHEINLKAFSIQLISTEVSTVL